MGDGVVHVEGDVDHVVEHGAEHDAGEDAVGVEDDEGATGRRGVMKGMSSSSESSSSEKA